MWDWVEEFWDALVAWVEGILDWLWSIIVAAFEAVYNWLYDILYSVITWVVDRFVSAVESLDFDIPTLADLLGMAPPETQAMLGALGLGDCLAIVSVGLVVFVILRIVRPGFWFGA